MQLKIKPTQMTRRPMCEVIRQLPIAGEDKLCCWETHNDFHMAPGPATVWRGIAGGKALVSFQPNVYKIKSVYLANHSSVLVGREVKALFVIL